MQHALTVFIIHFTMESKTNQQNKTKGEHLSATAVRGLWSYLTCLQRDWLWCTENSSPTATQSHENNCQTCSWAHRLPCRQHRCELLFILLTVSQTLVVRRHEFSCVFNCPAGLKSFSATDSSFFFLLEINIAFYFVSNFIRVILDSVAAFLWGYGCCTCLPQKCDTCIVFVHVTFWTSNVCFSTYADWTILHDLLLCMITAPRNLGQSF